METYFVLVGKHLAAEVAAVHPQPEMRHLMMKMVVWFECDAVVDMTLILIVVVVGFPILNLQSSVWESMDPNLHIWRPL